MADVTYRLDKNIDVDVWLRLYHCCGWNREWTARNAESMLRHAHLVITAWLGDEIVGTLTVLGDGLTYATIDDVVVHPTYRGRGIGSRLMQMAIQEVGHLGPHLEAIPGVAPFYKLLGFVVNEGHTPMHRPADMAHT